MNIGIGIFLLLNFSLLQSISAAPKQTDEWVVKPIVDKDETYVMLEGKVRSWKIVNKICFKMHDGEYAVLCETNGNLQGAFTLVSESDYQYHREYNDDSKWAGIVETYFDHGTLTIGGKTNYFFVFNFGNVSLESVHKTLNKGWTASTIAYIGKDIINKLQRVHFDNDRVFIRIGTLHISFPNSRQFLFGNAKLGKEATEERIRNVFSVIRDLLLLSIPPIRDPGAMGLPTLICYPNWANVAFNAANLEEDFNNNHLLKGVPIALKQLCIFILDESKRSEWKTSYGKIIEYFDRIPNINISPGDNWSELPEVTDFLQNLVKIDWNYVRLWQQIPTKSIIWAYISGFFARLSKKKPEK